MEICRDFDPGRREDRCHFTRDFAGGGFDLHVAVLLLCRDFSVTTDRGYRRLEKCIHNRRNWLFTWTELGAKHVGIVQSLLTTCRLHEINPYDYLVDVLQRVGTHPAARVSELTPRLWKQSFAKTPLRSDLYRL